VKAWFAAIQTAQRTNGSDLLGFAPYSFQLGMPSADIIKVATWLGKWQSTLVEPYIKASFGVTDLTQLAYVQWGTGLLPGVSVADLDPTVPAAPEFAIWALRNNNTIRFDKNRSITVLSKFLGANGTTPQFFQLLQANNLTAINAVYGFSPQEAVAFAGYLNYVMTTFVDANLRQVFAAGGGLVTARTAREILWEGIDPLISLLKGPAAARAGVFYSSDSDYPTRADAEASQPLQSSRIFTGGNKDELRDYLEIKQYKGKSVIAGYSNMTVRGNIDGAYWVPGSLSKTEPLLIWVPTVQRPLKVEFVDVITVKGIECWRYKVSDDEFKTTAENPDNARFTQNIHGLLNVTGIKTLRTYASRPHLSGVSDAKVVDTFSVMDENNAADNAQFFAINPLSGITMYVDFAAEVLVEFPKLSRYFNNSAGFAPITWTEIYQIIPDADADKFKSGVNGAQSGSIIAFVLGMGLGIILIAVGIFILVKYKSRTGLGDDQEVELKKVKTEKKSAPLEEEGTSSDESDSEDEEGDTSASATSEEGSTDASSDGSAGSDDASDSDSK
jgi:hypothetical protein